MHELSLAESILETIIEAIPDTTFNTAFDTANDSNTHANNKTFASTNNVIVTLISLSIGQLSCVDPDSLSWYLTQISENTPLEGATIQINNTPGIMQCLQCQKSFNTDEYYCCCPYCGSYDKQVTSGNEMLISQIEFIENS